MVGQQHHGNVVGTFGEFNLPGHVDTGFAVEHGVADDQVGQQVERHLHGRSSRAVRRMKGVLARLQ